MFFGLYETLALLIQGAYLMHEGLTPTSEKPKISFSCGLDRRLINRLKMRLISLFCFIRFGNRKLQKFTKSCCTAKSIIFSYHPAGIYIFCPPADQNEE